MKVKNKLRQFHPDYEGLPDILEFWEVDVPGHEPSLLQFVRTQGPFPEMFQWHHFREEMSEHKIDEDILESLRDQELEKE